MKKTLFCATVLTLGWVYAASALSPTNNYRQHIEERRSGEVAYLAEGVTLDQLKSALQANKKEIGKTVRKNKASNLSVFGVTNVNGKASVLIHRYDPPKGNKATLLDWPEDVRKLLVPHEHASLRADGEKTLLDMELICHLPCAADKKPDGEVSYYGLVTELRPEKEELYRTLHQTVWPAVIDQIGRSNYRHWTTWCTEVDGRVYLFAYFEYVGTDIEVDNAAMGKDPTTVRWWKITDACQKPLPQQEGKGGMWAGMDLLLHVD